MEENKKNKKVTKNKKSKQFAKIVKESIDVSNKDIEQEKDYRISIMREDLQKKKEQEEKRKEKINKRTKVKEDARQEDQYELPYTVIRREIDGIAPLHKLNIIDKFKVAFRFRDMKSGKTARREAEALRQQQLKNIKIESAIRRGINDKIEKVLNKEIMEAIVEVKVPKEHQYLIDKVLSGTYYNMFDINEVEINPNIKKYVESVPRVFHFKLR